MPMWKVPFGYALAQRSSWGEKELSSLKDSRIQSSAKLHPARHATAVSEEMLRIQRPFQLVCSRGRSAGRGNDPGPSRTLFFQKKKCHFTSALCRENRALFREYVRFVES